MKILKLSKIIACATAFTLLLTSCSKDEHHIKVPQLPNYSQYVELCDYKNLTYHISDDYIVNDEKINIAMHEQLSSLAEKTEITDRPVKENDEIVINYTGTIDGKSFNNGSTGTDGITIVVGYHNLPKEFEKQIIGLNIDETKDITVSFPDDFENLELKGKTAVFKTTVLKITEIKYPELTDDIIKEHTMYGTVAAYKTAIKNSLEQTYADYIKDSACSQILQQIKANSTITSYPEDIINELVETSVTAANNSANQNNMSLSEYISSVYNYTDETEYRSHVSEIAKEYMSTRMLMNEIARIENITVSDKEFEDYKTTFASDNNFDNTQAVNLYYRDSDLLLDMLYEKIEEWLMKNATQV